MNECPNCGSYYIRRDSASPWIFVVAILLFPIGLVAFVANRNAWCAKCGVRFKR